MALGTLTPADNWVAAPRKVTAGDGGKSADIASVLQDQADRSEYLKLRGVMENASDGDSSGTWGTTTFGSAITSTSWGQLAALGYSLAGDNLKAGTIVLVMATIYGKCADASDIANLRIVRKDDGGASAMVGNSGGIIAGTALQQVFLCAAFAIASDLASCEAQVEAKVLDASDSFQAISPCEMTVLVLRKF